LKGYHRFFDWRQELRWMDLATTNPPDLPSLDGLTRETRAAMDAARTVAQRAAALERYDRESDGIYRQLQAFYSSGEGRRFWSSKRRYVAAFSQDGSFRIEDVPGGKYELTIDAREFVPERGQFRSPLISERQVEIQVPDSPGGRSDTPYDVGTVELLAWLHPGDTAPDFTVKALDGKTLKLSDYKGKYVLLDFWAPSDASSAQETPNLKETYAAFKDDPRAVMIGLSLDAKAAGASEYVQRNQIAWTQGLLGPRPQCAVADQYGVDHLPLILLVGPDGRVLATGLRGGTIKSTLDAALNVHE
jgi:peroxiredoxin